MVYKCCFGCVCFNFQLSSQNWSLGQPVSSASYTGHISESLISPQRWLVKACLWSQKMLRSLSSTYGLLQNTRNTQRVEDVFLIFGFSEPRFPGSCWHLTNTQKKEEGEEKEAGKKEGTKAKLWNCFAKTCIRTQISAFPVQLCCYWIICNFNSSNVL